MDGIFLQQMINGLTLGSVYGLIAIGYTMVYGIIGMINFAHGEVYMISAYLSAIALALLAFFGLQNFPLLILGTLLFTVLVTCTYGWVIERIAYKPLRNSTRLAPLISAIGMSLILQNYVQVAQGPRQQGIPTLLDGALKFHVGDGFVQLTYTKLFILIASLIGMAVLTYVIRYTKLGRMCRATQQDRKMASILGINTDRVISYVFVIGAAMAAWPGADHHELRHLRLLRRLHHRHQGVHRGGARRHRLAARGDARRPGAGSGRGAVLRDGQHRLQGRVRLLVAGTDPDLPSPGPARPPADRQGVRGRR